MRAYYNEFDPKAAAWLRELIRRGLIASGDVDERSIKDVTANDLKGYGQVHLFAGIGGWSLALRLAGVPDTEPVWTGSCPCQPYSAAGKRKGQQDDRHLWPDMARLIRERKPAIVLGEQVASAIRFGWLDGVFGDLEAEGYACGAAVLGAHSVGAPHIRQRLFWVADARVGTRERGARGFPEKEEGVCCENGQEHGDSSVRLADGGEDGWVGHATGREALATIKGPLEPSQGCADGRLGQSDGSRREGIGRCREEGASESGSDGRLADAEHAERRAEHQEHGHAHGRDRLGRCGEVNWSRYVLIPCRDGKTRRIEPGLAPLVDGVPARVVRLRGYGNAIVPQVAAAFIEEVMECVSVEQMEGLTR